MRHVITTRRAITLALAVTVLTAASASAHAQQRAPQRATAGVDAPMTQSWTVHRTWNDAYETEYGAFVATIGRAVAAGRCHTLARCLNDPTINPLFEHGARPLNFRADCADTPYTLRAFFSYRKGLPFAYARRMAGVGHDVRYLREAHPEGVRLWTDFSTPRALLESIGSDVHSGYFRTAPTIEDSDFYQTTVDRSGIRPGTMYYDPNGHVLVVYEVAADGEILMFDGHPDNSLTHPHFTERRPLGSMGQGGGFKNFRPFSYEGGRIVRAPNAAIPAFGGGTQFDHQRYAVAGQPVTFYAWIRAELATGSATVAMQTATIRARCATNCTATDSARRSARNNPSAFAIPGRRRRMATPSATVSLARSDS